MAERLSQSVRTADTEKLDKTRMLGGVVAAMNPEAFRGDELNRALQGTRDSLSASGAAEADIQGLMDDLTGLAAEMRPKKETPPPKDDAAEKARKIPVYRGNAR
ncbi:hypothetical protein HY256_06870 [Candidatus Sumerlaeota bacterium]|nr:hypothetical protein [Candidatus Sumerlaeota bacterium]